MYGAVCLLKQFYLPCKLLILFLLKVVEHTGVRCQVFPRSFCYSMFLQMFIFSNGYARYRSVMHDVNFFLMVKPPAAS